MTLYLELKKTCLRKENDLITACKLILIVKLEYLEYFYRLKTENMAILTNDAREIRQPDNISLDSHKETTKTQTVATPVLGLLYSQLSPCGNPAITETRFSGQNSDPHL